LIVLLYVCGKACLVACCYKRHNTYTEKRLKRNPIKQAMHDIQVHPRLYRFCSFIGYKPSLILFAAGAFGVIFISVQIALLPMAAEQLNSFTHKQFVAITLSMQTQWNEEVNKTFGPFIDEIRDLKNEIQNDIDSFFSDSTYYLKLAANETQDFENWVEGEIGNLPGLGVVIDLLIDLIKCISWILNLPQFIYAFANLLPTHVTLPNVPPPSFAYINLAFVDAKAQELSVIIEEFVTIYTGLLQTHLEFFGFLTLWGGMVIILGLITTAWLKLKDNHKTGWVRPFIYRVQRGFLSLRCGGCKR